MIRTDLDPAARRMYRSMTAFGVAGLLVSAWYGGIPWALGFVTGAVFSALNFWVFHKVVGRIGLNAPAEGSGSNSTAVLVGMRYFVFAAAGYVILTSFEASILAALIGCFLAVAAVILEVLYELIYGT